MVKKKQKTKPILSFISLLNLNISMQMFPCCAFSMAGGKREMFPRFVALGTFLAFPPVCDNLGTEARTHRYRRAHARTHARAGAHTHTIIF